MCDKTQYSHKYYEWRLQIAPNTLQTYFSPYVCETNLSGIGIKFYDLNGNSVPCSRWSDLLIIPANVWLKKLPNLRVAELIRTPDYLPSPGFYSLSFTGLLNSYTPGLNKSMKWGDFTIHGDTTILVSGCKLDPAVNPVDFGNLLLDQQTHNVSKSFQISFSGCTNDADIKNFKDTAKLVFSSPTITADGKIGNCSDSNCAQNANITISDSSGNIDLLKQYSLKDKSGTLNYNFNANLNYSSNSTAGVINSSLIIIVSYY